MKTRPVGSGKLACLQFNYAHRPSQVLSIYRDAIRVARPISDLDSLATIIIDEAEFRVLPDGEQHRWIGDDRGNILIETISFYASDPAAAILIPCKPHLAFEYNPFA